MKTLISYWFCATMLLNWAIEESDADFFCSCYSSNYHSIIDVARAALNCCRDYLQCWKKIAQQSSTAMTSSGFSKHFQLRISLHSNTASFLDLIITLGDNEAHELSLKIYFSTLFLLSPSFVESMWLKMIFKARKLLQKRLDFS